MDPLPQIVDQYGRPAETAVSERGSAMQDAILKAFLRGHDIGVGNELARPTAQISWAYSCIIQTAIAAAQCEQVPYLTRGSGDSVQAPNHPIMERVREPIPDRLCDFQYREMWLVNLLAHGDVWLYIDEEDMNGIPRSLLLFNKKSVQPVRNGFNGPIVGWELSVEGGTRSIQVPLRDMVHWWLPNTYSMDMGLAPSDVVRAAMDSDFQKTLFDRSFFKHSANPSVVLFYKAGRLDKDQREAVREEWSQINSGPDNAGRAAVIAGIDWDIKFMGLEHTKTQFNESRKLTREEIAAAYYGFPVSLLNAQEAQGGLSKAGNETDRLRLYENCVIPQLIRHDASYNTFFIRKRVDRRLSIISNVDMIPAVLQSQLEKKSQIHARNVQSGISRNDSARMLDLDLDPIEGGDTAWIPANLQPLNGGGQPSNTIAGDGPANSLLGREPGIIARHCREKLKRILAVDIRRAACRGEVPEKKREWAKVLFSPIVAAIKVGYDDVRGGNGVFVDLPSEEIVSQLRTLQEQIGSGVRLSSEAMEREAVFHVKRALDFLDNVATNAVIEFQRNGVRGVTAYLDKLDQVARECAVRIVRSSYNAGIWLGAMESKKRICFVIPRGMLRRGCNHEGDRYPGDPGRPLGELRGCGCGIEAVEEGWSDEAGTEAHRALR